MDNKIWSGHEGICSCQRYSMVANCCNEQSNELRRTKDGRFAFLRVFGSGHMVPVDRGDYAIDMLSTWLHTELVYPS
ncbi:predicted protein [Lichtheimia corymbifera JMRC:FSU:9682]|uniref:Uncharacterized protein n=1 Tax=Lichtheimia corymbifera JMRC:FSU:9682 TaxID=1263082 RepID=A0A068RM76_9FUNG|nr:predicted protein [Lichtheimia corymbifera JMRC:FSU:9682]